MAVSAADPIHLGTITPKDGILLISNTRLTNWVCFAVELISHSSTNTIAFHTTNNILTFPNLSGLPEGLTTLKIRNCNDQIVSETLIHTIVIQRQTAPVPRATIIQLPPMPPGFSLPKAALTPRPPPLPGGTNVSYAEGRMREFYQRDRRRREP